MESKFIPVRGNPSSPTKNTDYPFWVIGIFLCAEDGVEVYPRQGKSIFPHQKYRLSFWTVGIFLSGRCTNARQMHGAEKIWIASVNTAKKKPHMIRPPTPWAGFCCSAPLTLPVRSGARPAPAATGRPRACQSNRRTPSARRAHGHRYASSHAGSGAKHTSHRRIRIPPFRLQNYYAFG